jgi:hypothetical protein|uniref:Uncharacterized protein n=1 Tax=viral metagenome TaxID=1070528 RepID=A0A6C0AI56_9ZZZZ
MFSIPMPIDFTQATESFAKSIVQAANERAAKLFSDHYGLPFDEVLTHLIGEVQLSKEEIILPPNKLPFCGRAGLKEGKCKGIVKNQGLFTLCQKNVKDDGYCSTCGKQAAKDGSPLNGDIDARESCEIDKYSVGKFVAKPYWCFMQKHNITEEQANASAMFHYGVTIDPIHFKPVTIARGRRATTEMKMGTPLEVLHMPDASDEVAEAAKAAEAEVAAEVSEAAKAAEVAEAEVAKATKAKAASNIPETNELEEGELDEEEVEDEVEETDEEVTADYINSMVMEDLQKFAESRGIPITENGKKLPPKKLRKNVCEQLQL